MSPTTRPPRVDTCRSQPCPSSTGRHAQAHQSSRSVVPGCPRPRHSSSTPASPSLLLLSCSSRRHLFWVSIALKCWQQAAVRSQDFTLRSRDRRGLRHLPLGLPCEPAPTAPPSQDSGHLPALQSYPTVTPRLTPASPPGQQASWALGPQHCPPPPGLSPAHGSPARARVLATAHGTHHRDSSRQPGSSRLSHSSRAPSSPIVFPAKLSSFRLSLALRTRQRSLQPLAVTSHSQSLRGGGRVSAQRHSRTQPREVQGGPLRRPAGRPGGGSPQRPELGAGAQQPRAQLRDARVLQLVVAQKQLAQ